ncbi:RIP metalloprotease RseP [Megasphaera vaginalis (ex Srinivasan et al. 2021)]|uniref:Zinc metalloprotease n=1 Tax=Megasphaera vaginalis (ex Srinivasan et al. 2021) TaxID=1111454 RepID=U7UHJ4_9FIRM|nr:RIP metalloprotease RseP [Megasphaera vaginalis (ex Srinivasan et al. 2021)]ERT58359.1 RIP metalloprotease RseP-like protein [Megasphaera vaginalis (ex Srinivasan et al. 2021)]
MGITIGATIFVFSVIVFVHEFGHFITAKMTGMQVDEFAIGFGPKLFSYQYGPTVYSLRVIPLGGFNRIAGMTEEEALNERSFLNKPILSRLIVIAAGAFMNFVLAVFIIWGLMFAVGTTEVSQEPIVGSVMTDSPAAQNRLQPGDRILSIGSDKITKWADISSAVDKHVHDIIPVVIEREGTRMTVSMIPKTDEQKRALLGITPTVTRQEHGFFESAGLAVRRTGEICYMMLDGLYRMVTGTAKAELAGPLGVAQLAGQVASLGFVNLLMFTAFLSINLGILNLLPIPMLDGGYLILILLEGIMRRRLPEKALYYIQVVGIAILGSLFVFAMLQDISRF